MYLPFLFGYNVAYTLLNFFVLVCYCYSVRTNGHIQILKKIINVTKIMKTIWGPIKPSSSPQETRHLLGISCHCLKYRFALMCMQDNLYSSLQFILTFLYCHCMIKTSVVQTFMVPFVNGIKMALTLLQTLPGFKTLCLPA